MQLGQKGIEHYTKSITRTIFAFTYSGVKRSNYGARTPFTTHSTNVCLCLGLIQFVIIQNTLSLKHVDKNDPFFQEDFGFYYN